MGKWSITYRASTASSHHTVLAVCEDGCPDFKPSCADIFNQIGCTEGHTEDNCLHCPIWPAAWNSAMKWNIVKTTSGSPSQSSQMVEANAFCCKRKPQECDACTHDTCSGLIGLLHDTCPPNEPSFWQGKLSKLQTDCCQEQKGDFGKTCFCKLPTTQCDYGADALQI